MTAPEITKVAVETSGQFSGLWGWLGASVVGCVGWIARKTHSRISALEDKIVCKKRFEEFITKSEEHRDATREMISNIQQTVARIEGRMGE